jgi:hypothetical protein
MTTSLLFGLKCNGEFNQTALTLRPHDRAKAFDQSLIAPRVISLLVNPYALYCIEQLPNNQMRLEFKDRAVFVSNDNKKNVSHALACIELSMKRAFERAGFGMNTDFLYAIPDPVGFQTRIVYAKRPFERMPVNMAGSYLAEITQQLRL